MTCAGRSARGPNEPFGAKEEGEASGPHTSQAHPDEDVAMDAEGVRASATSARAVTRGLREHGARVPPAP